MKKQIILAMLDIESVFDEYSEHVESLLQKEGCNQMAKKALEKISNKHFSLMYSIFEDIYEALDSA